MSKQLEWAEDFIKRFDKAVVKVGKQGMAIRGEYYELRDLANAIIADAEADSKEAK